MILKWQRPLFRQKPGTPMLQTHGTKARRYQYLESRILPDLLSMYCRQQQPRQCLLQDLLYIEERGDTDEEGYEKKEFFALLSAGDHYGIFRLPVFCGSGSLRGRSGTDSLFRGAGERNRGRLPGRRYWKY